MVKQVIEKFLIPAGNYIVGFADLKGLIDAKFNGYQYGISIGKRLDNAIIDKIKNGPTLEYYNYYNQINSELSELAKEIKKELIKIHIDPIIIEPTLSTDSEEFSGYLKTLSVDISHKMVATRAGLGWIGKTDLFISTKFGPRLRLVSILIDKKIEGNSIPVDRSKCGKCAICL